VMKGEAFHFLEQYPRLLWGLTLGSVVDTLKLLSNLKPGPAFLPRQGFTSCRLWGTIGAILTERNGTWH